MIAALTIPISFFALIVALFSLAVSAEKFRLDLYNKRFEIYVRTVKFYQILIRSREKDERFSALQEDFIFACRESKFLFNPKSGVYDLLNKLNNASFKIIGLHDMPKGLPPDHVIANDKQIHEALMLWNSSMEALEDLMAPYLNYHYAYLPFALLSGMRKNT
jgi:hypothetical protein